MPSPIIDINKDGKTVEWVNQMVKAEALTLSNMVVERDGYKKRNATWQDIQAQLNELSESASFLYGYKSHFNQYKGTSDDESIVSITPDRNASLGSYSIIPKQIALPHKIASRSVSLDETLPASLVVISIADEELTINFKGGGILALQKTIETVQKKKILIKSTVVQKDKDNRILILTTAETGSNQKITIKKDPGQLFEFLDLFGFKEKESIDLLKAAKKEQNISIIENTIQLSPLTAAEITTDFQALNHSMKFTVDWKPINDKDEAKADENNKNQTVDNELEINQSLFLGPIDTLFFEDISLDASALESFHGALDESQNKNIPDLPVLPEKEPIIDDTIVTISTDNAEKTFKIGSNFILNQSGSRDFSLNLEELLNLPENSNQKIINIKFINNNTKREYLISNLKVSENKREYGAKNEISSPQDAIVNYEGVDIIRSQNTIDDLLKNSSLQIKRPSSHEITLNVDYDLENIKNSIINFIYQYNLSIHLLNLVLSTETEIPVDLENEEQEIHGIFRSETTLNILSRKLKLIMMNPYVTDYENELSLLSHLGISTGTFNVNTPEVDRGKLEMQEETFDTKFSQLPDGVQQLFGNDTDNDNVIDNGCAYQLYNTIRPYLQNGGMISVAMDQNNARIRQKNKEISDYERYLDDYRAQKRKEFSEIEQAQQEAESTKNWIDQQMKQ